MEITFNINEEHIFNNSIMNYIMQHSFHRTQQKRKMCLQMSIGDDSGNRRKARYPLMEIEYFFYDTIYVFIVIYLYLFVATYLWIYTSIYLYIYYHIVY